jgi:hypothetical protein
MTVPRHHLFQDHRIIGDVTMQRLLALGAEVCGQLFVVFTRAVLAVVRAAREPDDIVFDWRNGLWRMGLCRGQNVTVTKSGGPRRIAKPPNTGSPVALNEHVD